MTVFSKTIDLDALPEKPEPAVRMGKFLDAIDQLYKLLDDGSADEIDRIIRKVRRLGKLVKTDLESWARSKTKQGEQ